MSDHICEGYEDAPFCAGESLQECPDGTEVAENTTCTTTTLPDCWTNEEGCVGPATNQTYDSPDPVDVSSCEEDGTCDDSCTAPARGDCTLGQEVTVVPDEPVLAELPATGPDQIVSLALMAAMALTAGIGLIRR